MRMRTGDLVIRLESGEDGKDSVGIGIVVKTNDDDPAQIQLGTTYTLEELNEKGFANVCFRQMDFDPEIDVTGDALALEECMERIAPNAIMQATDVLHILGLLAPYVRAGTRAIEGWEERDPRK
jgi:hypothetical protein